MQMADWKQRLMSSAAAKRDPARAQALIAAHEACRGYAAATDAAPGVGGVQGSPGAATNSQFRQPGAEEPGGPLGELFNANCKGEPI